MLTMSLMSKSMMKTVASSAATIRLGGVAPLASTNLLMTYSISTCRPLAKTHSISTITDTTVSMASRIPSSCFPHNDIVRIMEPRSPGRYQHHRRCFSSFSFAGPKNLDDILQKEKVNDLPSSEIADLWMSYHEQKDSIHGIVRNGEEGIKLLERAKKSPFFVQPVVKENQGFYMLVSQFMEPCHFILAYLEDYRLDPAAANPLMSFSVFTDYSSEKDLTLVRVDVTNKGLEDHEGYKVASLMLDSYAHDDEYNQLVLPFNAQPDKFDFEGFISRQQEKWKTSSGDPAETEAEETTK